jgi:hypothetical protein
MMWILILLAININNPRDIPGRIELLYENENQCLYSLNTLKYELKFKNFKIEGQCKKY